MGVVVATAVHGIGYESREPEDTKLAHSALRIRNISAPVFDRTGKVVLTLTLIGLPKQCDPRQLAQFRDRLLMATEAIRAAVSGRRP